MLRIIILMALLGNLSSCSKLKHLLKEDYGPKESPKSSGQAEKNQIPQPEDWNSSLDRFLAHPKSQELAACIKKREPGMILRDEITGFHAEELRLSGYLDLNPYDSVIALAALDSRINQCVADIFRRACKEGDSNSCRTARSYDEHRKLLQACYSKNGQSCLGLATLFHSRDLFWRAKDFASRSCELSFLKGCDFYQQIARDQSDQRNRAYADQQARTRDAQLKNQQLLLLQMQMQNTAQQQQNAIQSWANSMKAPSPSTPTKLQTNCRMREVPLNGGQSVLQMDCE